MQPNLKDNKYLEAQRVSRAENITQNQEFDSYIAFTNQKVFPSKEMGI